MAKLCTSRPDGQMTKKLAKGNMLVFHNIAAK